MFEEYPRPQMARRQWWNLCGSWDYAITKTAEKPSFFNGQILVPFSPETPASGVNRKVGPGDWLWYHRRASFADAPGRVLLHFGAVDQRAVVWVNGVEAGSHVGGYTPFEMDITDVLDGDREAEILVCVRDETEASPLARGKQTTKRGGIWYTPQSGIWQPVWAEAVPENHIRGLRITPDYDNACVLIEADPAGTVYFQGRDYECPARVSVPDFIPWSPENPHLYDFTVTLGEDRVESYFAMRKFSAEGGKLCLNNAPYFHNGVLDQGYNPQGLYTYPSDEAMIADITLAKSLGFNTLRKHIKVEPLRWYYHCDRLGMLVWQDMPSGGGKYNPAVIQLPVVANVRMKDNKYRLFARADALGREQYMKELDEMLAALYNCPCIALWVPFNEGWGQFDAVKVREHIKALDPTRTVDHASGWHDQGGGETQSLHVYFKPYKYEPDSEGRAVLLSEFGGYNLRIEDHTFNNKDFGYNRCRDAAELLEKLKKLYENEIAPAKKAGLAAAIYTQLTDVEDELNGFITYDRELVKLPPDQVRKIIEI